MKVSGVSLIKITVQVLYKGHPERAPIAPVDITLLFKKTAG